MVMSVIALMASHQPPPSIYLSAAQESSSNASCHDVQRRVFVGPIPEKVISQTEAHIKKEDKQSIFHRTSSNQSTPEIPGIIKQNAFSFFIREGGSPEDWGEDEERNAVEEMLRRWKDSEWREIWRRREEKKAAAQRRHLSHWVGGSFEIGRFLGVNILHEMGEHRSIASGSVRVIPTSMSHETLANGSIAAGRPSTGQETFVTASSHLGPSISRVEPHESTPETVQSSYRAGSLPASSSASLLRPALERIGGDVSKTHTEVLPRPIFKQPSNAALGDTAIPTDRKGKGRLVHYADAPIQVEETPPLTEETPAPLAEDSPVPPSEVLERTGHELLQDTSAGAAVPDTTPDSPTPPSLDWGDVMMKDRMLVRTYYTKSESISPKFDEVQHRTTRNLLDADWGEYIVAWRRDRIELYCDYRFPGKEWLTGHKKLAFVIPLRSSRTQLSLYSFVDLTFCLTCQPTKPIRDDTKTRRTLGGELPTTIEVRNPRLDSRVKIDIPQADSGQVAQVFSRENTIALCANALRSVPDWKNLMERTITNSKMLQLAWRVDTKLDWIWLDDDIEGLERQWAVLCGLVMKLSSRPPALEIRVAEHCPTYINLKNGSRLHEPPAIEGYVVRIRPNSQMRQNLYIATHDGNLFVMTPNYAYPPAPPGLAQNLQDMELFAETLRKSEIQRGAMQIMYATGVNDLRTVLHVRRASHPILEPLHKEASSSQDSDIWFNIWSQPEERTIDDDHDEGGEEGLAKAEDKTRLRMRRSFELLLVSGRVVRFEVHSCRVAVEWVERLRALVLYWKQRHRIDAKEEMDIAQSARPRLTPLTRVARDDCDLPPEAPVDMSAPMPGLGSLYNWCVLEGCKSIVKGGKVYVRKGLYGQYK
ncbi:hypothetical protein H0H81_010398 [Sphagnurus paluster]|uniref:Prospore membrane adapter protein SPO71 PH domain-containing protein n=1 Tax=Sphagnurus paluster TaxID=117069 RepID=A0A9P7GKJ0_9AGAR|nr:hypothetical protein H0H81_010398 [Sphagnurus paluster]